MIVSDDLYDKKPVELGYTSWHTQLGILLKKYYLQDINPELSQSNTPPWDSRLDHVNREYTRMPARIERNSARGCVKQLNGQIMLQATSYKVMVNL